MAQCSHEAGSPDFPSSSGQNASAARDEQDIRVAGLQDAGGVEDLAAEHREQGNQGQSEGSTPSISSVSGNGALVEPSTSGDAGMRATGSYSRRHKQHDQVESEEERQRRRKEVMQKVKQETAKLRTMMEGKEPSQSLPAPQKSPSSSSIRHPSGPPSLDTSMFRAKSEWKAGFGTLLSPVSSSALGSGFRSSPQPGFRTSPQPGFDQVWGNLSPRLSINMGEEVAKLSRAEKQRRAEIEAKAEALTRGFRSKKDAGRTTPTHRRGSSGTQVPKQPSRPREKKNSAPHSLTYNSEPKNSRSTPTEPKTAPCSLGTKDTIPGVSDFDAYKKTGDLPVTRTSSDQASQGERETKKAGKPLRKHRGTDALKATQSETSHGQESLSSPRSIDEEFARFEGPTALVRRDTDSKVLKRAKPKSSRNGGRGGNGERRNSEETKHGLAPSGGPQSDSSGLRGFFQRMFHKE